MKIQDETKIHVWVIVLLAVCFGLWLFVYNNASARQMSNTECYNISTDMKTIAEMRDRHVDQIEVAKLVDRVLRPHLGEEDSYVQFETDIQFMVEMVQVIYESKLSAANLEQSAYAACRQYGYGVGYKIGT